MKNELLTNTISITLDVDWAPDFVINHVKNLLVEASIPATWLITHNSPAIQQLLKKDDLFDFGVHPNLLKKSTQGNSTSEVMGYLQKIVPSPKIIRTHSLYQSTRFFEKMACKFNIEIDSSLYLPHAQQVLPHYLYFPKGKILRLPFIWEDDLVLCQPTKDFVFKESNYNFKGLKILTFHPIHIYLNSKNLTAYETCKNSKEKRDIKPHINEKKGIGTFFNGLLDSIMRGNKQAITMSEIGKLWKEK